MRARGFYECYNTSLPLSVIFEFVDRHQFSASGAGLHFPSEILRKDSMRAIWNLSASEVVTTIEKAKRIQGSKRE
jgi:hypothetical protein